MTFVNWLVFLACIAYGIYVFSKQEYWLDKQVARLFKLLWAWIIKSDNSNKPDE
jgi:hypothetical protein